MTPGVLRLWRAAALLWAGAAAGARLAEARLAALAGSLSLALAVRSPRGRRREFWCQLAIALLGAGLAG
ncbi:MAG: hypothetical protein D6718_00470, partial [Acidobacteria bacterium]